MRHERIENEALALFEFGVEEEFRRRGKVVLDSSLGLIGLRRPLAPHKRKGEGPKH